MANSSLIRELEDQFAQNPRRVFARLANEYRKSGELDRAIEICRSHVPQQPTYISGYIVLGQALYESGRAPEAREAFESALALDPENLIALRHLGDVARDSGDLGEAESWYRRLLEVDPQNEEATRLLDELGGGALGGEAVAPGGQGSSATDDESAPAGGEPLVELQDAMSFASHEQPEGDGRPAGQPTMAGWESTELSVEPPAPAEQSDRLSPSDAEPAALEFATPELTVPDVMEPELPPAEPPVASARGAEAEGAEASGPNAGFVTETMAELYLQQGYRAEALAIYRQLLEQDPSSAALRERVDGLERSTAASAARGQTVREFFGALAHRRPPGSAPAASMAPAMGRESSTPDERQPAGVRGMSAAAEPSTAPEPLPAPERSAAAGPSAAPAERSAAAEPPALAAEPVPVESLGQLFADLPVSAEDDAAASALASAVQGLVTSDPARTPPSVNGAGHAELVSFDDFFSSGGGGEKDGGQPSEAEEADDPKADPSTDLASFQAWLEGLKK